jgi:hypothetical protein
MIQSDLGFKKKEPAKVRSSFFELGHKSLYKVGGISLIAGGLCYLLATLEAYTPGANGWAEPPFVSAQTFITAMANHAHAAYLTWGFFTMVDFLALPVMIALYFALKGVNRDAVMVGIGLLLMSVILDAAVAEVGFFTGTSLSVTWAATTDPVLKAAYLAAATHAVLQTEFAWPYSYFLGFAGWIVITAVMRKSVFGKWIGWFGLVASTLFVLDMASVYVVPGVAAGLILPLQWAFVAFYMIAGVRLFNLGRKQPQLETAVPPREQIIGR